MNYCGNCFKEYPGSVPCPHCGHNPAEDVRRFPQALRAGSVLDGRYIVGRPLGQGGFGITYKAMDYDTQQLVAIKEFVPGSIVFRGSSQKLSVLSDLQANDFERAKADFLSEAKTLSQFNGLDNICDIYSYFEENGTAYFAMEYADGMPLDSYVKKLGKPLSFEQARDILLPVMEALGHVHEKGIVHRDISPDNIILRPDGRAMLIDFGAARYSAGEKTKSLTVVLKHGFAPKEQYTRRGKQGPFTDVYALAATMYWLICGKVPPEAIDRFTNDELLPPSKLGIKIPPKAERALLKALAVDENQRYRSMKDFAAALRPAAAKPKPEPKKKPETQPKPKSRRGILIAAVCAVIAVAAGIGIFSKSAPAPAPTITPLAATAAPTATASPALKYTSGELHADGTLYIDSSIKDYDSSNPPWYKDRDKIKAVVIGDGAQIIGEKAFKNCTNLRTVTIPDSVTEIHWDAFLGCSALESLVLPDSVTRIDNYAFSSCKSLKSVTIPNSVTEISHGAFYGCSALESVVIPASVTRIGYDAFSGCNAIKTVYYSGTEEQWNSITFDNGSPLRGAEVLFGRSSAADWQLDNSGTLYINASTKDYSPSSPAPWYEKRDEIKALVISDSVTSIGNYAFNSLSSLESVTIPDSLTHIGSHAFRQCSALESVTIPDSVTVIKGFAFSECTSLKSVTLPAHASMIGDAAFSRCTALESIDIPDSVTEIGIEAFTGCSSLKSVTIPDSVTTISKKAFYGCKSLKSVDLPASLTVINEETFAECSALKSVTIPDSVTEIGNNAFLKCSSLESVVIPYYVTEISHGCFEECKQLKEVTIPVSVTSIKSSAFYLCNLSSVYYSGSVTQWNNIDFNGNPGRLSPANIHCNS